MAERLVVVGGDAAGMAAASQARRGRADLEIVALEKGRWTSYSACGIPFVVAGEVGGFEELVARTPKEFRSKWRIDVRMGHEAMAIDLHRREVEVRDHPHDRTFRLGFDQLLVATGGKPVRPALPGLDSPEVFGVQTLDDGEALLRHAEANEVRRVVVVGGGYIGLEMAEAFVRRGAEVVVVDSGDEVMRTLDPEVGAQVHAAMEGIGIEVRTGVEVEGFEPGKVLTAEGPLRADLVVLGLGVGPNSDLATDAGVGAGAAGAIGVDRRQRTDVDGVWAAGDCAESFHLVSGEMVHVALGTVANKQGRVAGINLGGGYASFPGVVGTAITRVCGLEVARTGLNEAQATDAGFRHVSASVESTTRAGYYPGAEPMTVKLLAEWGTGRLLGGQIVGGAGAGKRIDVLATALHAKLTLEQLVDLDLAYAPPFSSVWDPVQQAGWATLRALADPGRATG